MSEHDETTARGHRTGRFHGRRIARLSALIGLAILPTVLTSCQQALDLMTRLTTQHVAGPTLEGTYRLIYDVSNGRANGAPMKVQSDKVLWAFRSACQKAGCVATGTALDRDNAHESLSPPLTIVLVYRDGSWQGWPSKVPVSTQGPCLGPGNTLTGQADVTTAEAWQFWPQEDGTLTGRLTATVLTNECGDQGISLQVPLTATHAGDVAPEIEVPDPDDVAARDLRADRSDPPGPVFNGVYSFYFDHPARTRNGVLAPIGLAWTELWTMRSICNSPTHCIATGSSPRANPRAMVFGSAGATWQSLSPTLTRWVCVGLPITATAISEMSLDASDSDAIRGTQTVTILSNECGDQGAVYSTPVVVRKTSEEPQPDIEVADPHLFLP